MDSTVKSAPAFLPEGSEHIMEPSMEEHSHAMSLEHYARQPHCDVPLYIGVFFDGTNNNRDRDDPMSRRGQPRCSQCRRTSTQRRFRKGSRGSSG